MGKKRKRPQRGPTKKKPRGRNSKDIGRDVKAQRESRKEKMKSEKRLTPGARVLHEPVCLFCLEALPEAESEAHDHRLACLESKGSVVV